MEQSIKEQWYVIVIGGNESLIWGKTEEHAREKFERLRDGEINAFFKGAADVSG